MSIVSVMRMKMKIKLTYEGKEYIVDNVSVGGQIKMEYVTTNGETKIYYIKICNSEKAVMN